MIGWDILLGAALEAGFGLLAEVGFGDELRDSKERLTRREDKTRRVAFERAFKQAVQAAGENSLRPLLEHQPFRAAVITSLLDPTQPFDPQAAAEVWGEALPAHARALQKFFRLLVSGLNISLPDYPAPLFQSDFYFF